MPTSRRNLVGTLLVVVLAGLVWYFQSGTSAPDVAPGVAPDDRSGLPAVSVSDLPPEAAETLALIEAGGPFPYPGNDGKVFGNREDLLPERPAGYYREYTVPTPGSDDRGARRIVTGGTGSEPTEYYWTDDHYRSFERID
jgi:ribonuclease T1